MRLASNFRNSAYIRADRPLLDEEILQVAPSIFARAAHESRSDRYTYIPTVDVLNGLRKEGFEPFMACQTRVRVDEKRDHTKHMIRLRHASQINGEEADEIILLNSHDGTSSYQMLAGIFRSVCCNGLVCGDSFGEIRVRHQGNIVNEVIEGAYTVLNQFEAVRDQMEVMKDIYLFDSEQSTFAHTALALKYDESINPAPITAEQLLKPRRWADIGCDLWSVFNRVQENLIKGGVRGRSYNGRMTKTRAVSGIDQNLKLNKALWILADKMLKTKA